MGKIKEEVKKRKKAIITVLGVGLASIVSYRVGYRRGFDHAVDNIIIGALNNPDGRVLTIKF